MSLWIEVIGFIAAILTTASGLPQLIKSLKTKRTKDISLSMAVVSVIGIFFWLVYGLLIKAWPIILADIVALPIWILILVFKLKYK